MGCLLNIETYDIIMNKFLNHHEHKGKKHLVAEITGYSQQTYKKEAYYEFKRNQNRSKS
ncbi:hypothetical protein DESHY_10099 [Desulforamulus hydrothermalis Lam5 = DSM 18033]|uniref:Uncharacterized protein n=1 Tax=Desulforamulus hydrothermalis Lam5 = DSM 18033 TaxID=1121428 RepID=K8DWW1_9FIRM|nr:hypothetical protein DESHY_10099 [Desulforamulus hydrothermalis Lam5 = DSM 18033]